MYAPHIDFHVGGIENYLQSRLASNGHQPFLSRAILDLPSTHLYLGIVGEALNPFGKLVTWNPSITQTIKCLQVVEEQDLPFVLETVLEVGSGSGGREWDVRSVLPRAIQNSVTSVSEVLEVLEGASEEASGDEVGNAEVVQATNTPDFEPTHSKSSSGWETICRPKVGLKVEGGGFIGLWRRKYFRDKVPCTS
jgi:tRNA (adenine57-N1/adenine58-N1)-methyltransferase